MRSRACTGSQALTCARGFGSSRPQKVELDGKGSWTMREDILEGQRDLVSPPTGASKPPAVPSTGRARCLLPLHTLFPFLERPSSHS